LCLLLAGCSSFNTTAAPTAEARLPITGMVRGGQAPIVGSQVYLFAANTTGYGGPGMAASNNNASISLLTSVPGSTFLDQSGGVTNGDYYVTTSGVTGSCPTGGCFALTGDYSCAAGQQVYLYALGGTQGGIANPAAGLLLALGSCPGTPAGTPGETFPSSLYVVINEVSTVATAYAFEGFVTDATHVGSSGTALALTGIANAFANAANLETLGTGTALATTPAGNGTVPQAEINTLANILAACVNSSRTGSACMTLFANATVDGTTTGAQPTDTASAAINIAHNPGANVAALYGIATGTPQFGPALTAQPNDLTIALSFTGGGMNSTEFIAIDASGSVWVMSTDLNVFFCNGALTKLSSSGAVLSGALGYLYGSGLSCPYGLAVDGSGNAWVVASSAENAIGEFSNSGTLVSSSGGYTGGLNDPELIAIDGSGNPWVTWSDGYTSVVSEFSGSGTLLSAYTYSPGGATSIAIDGAGDIWTPNVLLPPGKGYLSETYTVSELSRAGSILSGASGYAPISAYEQVASIAVDSSGDAWVTYKLANEVIEISQSGAILSGANGYAVNNSPVAIAIDGSGDALVLGVNNLSKLSSSGTILSGGGYAVGSSGGFALDGSGNAWIGSGNGIIELIGVATPVITPICAGLPATPTADGSSNLGTRP
jgi:hypothetical protein